MQPQKLNRCAAMAAPETHTVVLNPDCWYRPFGSPAHNFSSLQYCLLLLTEYWFVSRWIPQLECLWFQNSIEEDEEYTDEGEIAGNQSLASLLEEFSGTYEGELHGELLGFGCCQGFHISDHRLLYLISFEWFLIILEEVGSGEQAADGEFLKGFTVGGTEVMEI